LAAAGAPSAAAAYSGELLQFGSESGFLAADFETLARLKRSEPIDAPMTRAAPRAPRARPRAATCTAPRAAARTAQAQTCSRR